MQLMFDNVIFVYEKYYWILNVLIIMQPHTSDNYQQVPIDLDFSLVNLEGFRGFP